VNGTTTSHTQAGEVKMIDRLILTEQQLSQRREAELERRLELARLLKEGKPASLHPSTRLLWWVVEGLIALGREPQRRSARQQPTL
jgi:hypothetical protein